MKTRRIISFLLAMLMVINLMPMTVQAEETTEQMIVLNLKDSYGDGWNDASITVSYGETKESYTIQSGSSATYTIPYNESKSYTFTWNSGSYDDECSFKILVQGNQVYTCDNGESLDNEELFYSIDVCEHSFGEGSTCTKCKQVCGVDFEHEVLEDTRACVCGAELLKVTAEVSGIKFEGANWVAMNTEYTAQLSVLDGYMPIETITVSIGGVEITSYSFTEGKLTIPAESVNGEITITAVADALPRYDITINDIAFGSVTTNTEDFNAYEGQSVSLTITPDTGYLLETLTVVDENNEEISVTNNTFVMPGRAVCVTATFVKDYGDFKIEGEESGWDITDDVLTFTKSGEYTVSMASGKTKTQQIIVVEAEEVILTLNNLNITAPNGDKGWDVGTDGGCALTLKCKTNLVLIGENTLTGGSGGCLYLEGYNVGKSGGSGISGTASIFGEGSLTVCGGEGTGVVVGLAGDGGAGILGDITLNSGMVTVIGGAGGKGEVFDEGMYGTPGDGGIGIAGDITLNGGTVTVIGGAGGDLESGEYEIDESGDNGIGINGQITVADNMLVTIKAGESEAYAEVVDAYDGETYVQITVTECTEHMDAGLDGRCDNCKTIIAYIIAPTSKLLGTNETVANISMNPSNGYVSAGGSVTVTAQDMLGYTFKGWYLSSDIDAETNQIIAGKEAQSTSFAYTFEPNADIQLVAVYEAAGKVDVTFSGSDFTVSVDDGEATTPQNGTYTSQIAIGSKVTVTVKDESFINWLNENKKIVTTENTYTFTVTGNVTLTMSKKGTSGSTAMVEFVSAYNQVIASQIYDGDDTITFPDGPSKMGYTFTGWNLTQNEIHTKITAGETHITVTPVYEQDTSVKYTVTVYVDGVMDNEQMATGILPGSTKTVNAPVVDGKVFLYWTDADGNILGYDTSYFMQINKDIVVKAVYGEEAVEAKPVIAMTNVFTAYYDDKNILSFSVTRDIPEGYTLVEHGMLYNKLGTITNPTEDIFILGGTGVSKYVSTATKLSGVFTLNVMVTNVKDVKVAARGYMIVKDSEGKEEIYYTDMAYISYNEIAENE